MAIVIAFLRSGVALGSGRRIGFGEIIRVGAGTKEGRAKVELLTVHLLFLYLSVCWIATERKDIMPKSRFFGIRCKCGVLIPVRDATQPEPVELETARERLKQDGWTVKIVLHAPSGCFASNECRLDDLLLMPSRQE